MSGIKVGDIVARKSYGYDILFEVADIREDGPSKIATLMGINYRLEADAPETDLEVQSEKRLREEKNRCMQMAHKKLQESTSPLRYRGYSKKAYCKNTPKEEVMAL